MIYIINFEWSFGVANSFLKVQIFHVVFAARNVIKAPCIILTVLLSIACHTAGHVDFPKVLHANYI